MKKLFGILFLFAVCIAMSSCGGGEKKPEPFFNHDGDKSVAPAPAVVDAPVIAQRPDSTDPADYKFVKAYHKAVEDFGFEVRLMQLGTFQIKKITPAMDQKIGKKIYGVQEAIKGITGIDDKLSKASHDAIETDKDRYVGFTADWDQFKQSKGGN